MCRCLGGAAFGTGSLKKSDDHSNLLVVYVSAKCIRRAMAKGESLGSGGGTCVQIVRI